MLTILMFTLLHPRDGHVLLAKRDKTQHAWHGWVAQVPEYGIQAALVLAMLLSRRWVVLCIELPVLAYHVRTFALDNYKTDVTEIFRQLPRERRKRIVKLAIYMGGFVFIVYKCDCAEHAIQAPASRAVDVRRLTSAACLHALEHAWAVTESRTLNRRTPLRWQRHMHVTSVPAHAAHQCGRLHALIDHERPKPLLLSFM